VNRNITTISTLCLFLLLLMAGCAPSVRYTREQPVNQVGQSDSKKPSSQRPKVVGDVSGVDSLQSSGWEPAASGGDEDLHQSGWLVSALSEADEGQSHRQAVGVKGKGGPQQRLELVINSYLGVPYRYGGTTRNGFDCSGFTSAVYREVYGIELNRTSGAMWKDGAPVSLSSARPGDLVFFKGGRLGRINHVGIYVGGNRFAHSSTSSGVVYNSLQEDYYAKRFAGVRRMY
jgi:murein DD-endopeptidase / murein LD-carboxypeptidase